MAHPSTINKNTLKVYHPNNIVLHPTKQILSINLNQWKENLAKKLSELCIETIANNWEVFQLINELPMMSDVTRLLEILRTDLDLELTVPKIAYESYWLRCYKSRWPSCPPADRNFSEVEELTWQRKEVINSGYSSIEEVSNEDLEQFQTNDRRYSKSAELCTQRDNVSKTWKELYLEKHIQEYLENLEVEHYDSEKIKNTATLCKKYVTVLKLRQLRAPISTNSPDHIPLNSVLVGFSYLKELCLCFKQKYVGERFSWHIFNTTITDIKNLAKGLEHSKLEILRIQNSDINCIKVKMLLKRLDKNDKLKELEFSHCKIADHGVMAISKFIKEHNNIVRLNLVNNYIGYEGAKSLAYVLMEDEHLSHLNLRLNIINSKGGRYLFFALIKGINSLKELNLAGCGLNARNVEIEEMLRCNDTLHRLDLSNNRMGKEIGRQVLKGLQFNATLVNLDCRRCEFSSNVETKISEICEKNRYKSRSKEICGDLPEHQVLDAVHDVFSKEFLNDFHNVLSDF